MANHDCMLYWDVHPKTDHWFKNKHVLSEMGTSVPFQKYPSLNKNQQRILMTYTFPLIIAYRACIIGGQTVWSPWAMGDVSRVLTCLIQVNKYWFYCLELQGRIITAICYVCLPTAVAATWHFFPIPNQCWKQILSFFHTLVVNMELFMSHFRRTV